MPVLRRRPLRQVHAVDEGQDQLRVTYRDNYEHLVEVKNKYDPTNLFGVIQGIEPSEPSPFNSVQEPKERPTMDEAPAINVDRLIDRWPSINNLLTPSENLFPSSSPRNRRDCRTLIAKQSKGILGSVRPINEVLSGPTGRSSKGIDRYSLRRDYFG